LTLSNKGLVDCTGPIAFADNLGSNNRAGEQHQEQEAEGHGVVSSIGARLAQADIHNKKRLAL